MEHAAFSFFQNVYLIAFYTIGAALGFMSFRFSKDKQVTANIDNNITAENIVNGVVTTGVGVFLAYILAGYLEEEQYFSTKICMLIGGLASFGLPDIIVKHYPDIEKKVIQMLFNRVSTNKDTKNESN